MIAEGADRDAPGGVTRVATAPDRQVRVDRQIATPSLFDPGTGHVVGLLKARLLFSTTVAVSKWEKGKIERHSAGDARCARSDCR
jgi:hypothetical protein